MSSPDYFDGYTRSARLGIADTALIPIDLQYASGSRHHGLGRVLAQQQRLHEAQYRFDRIESTVLPNTRRLLDYFRSVGARVVHVTLGAELEDFSDASEQLRETFRITNNRVGTKEHEVLEPVRPIAGEVVVNKRTMGAFASTGLEAVLKAFGIRHVVCCGVSTNNCVDGTARQASDLGFSAVLCADATGTCSEEMQDVTLRTFTRLWGRVMTADEVIAEMEAGRAPARIQA